MSFGEDGNLSVFDVIFRMRKSKDVIISSSIFFNEKCRVKGCDKNG